MMYLPDDIWYMVCKQLWLQRDLNTLFNCTRAGKQLAAPAVKYLYRMQDVSQSQFLMYYHERLGNPQTEWKCALKWRTIVLSSLGKTLYPYSQYIRALSLYDLSRMLTRSEFSHAEVRALFQQTPQLKSLVGTVPPALLKSILSENNLHLTSLESEYRIRLKSTQTTLDKKLNLALANQTSLQKLRLTVDAEDRYGVRLIVECLSKLVNLTDLYLESSSIYILDRDIARLASCLQKLEVCSMDGGGLTDAIWSEFGSLRSLRKLEIDGLSAFTTEGILGFIERLGPGNEGLELSLKIVDFDNELLWDAWNEEDVIAETIAKKVRGRFYFGFNQDPFQEPEPEC